MSTNEVEVAHLKLGKIQIPTYIILVCAFSVDEVGFLYCLDIKEPNLFSSIIYMGFAYSRNVP